MFNIFALVLVTVTTAIGPPGSHGATIQMTSTGFATEAQCNEQLASPTAEEQKKVLLSYLNAKVKDEFKGHMDVQFICSNKSVEELAPEGSDAQN